MFHGVILPRCYTDGCEHRGLHVPQRVSFGCRRGRLLRFEWRVRLQLAHTKVVDMVVALAVLVVMLRCCSRSRLLAEVLALSHASWEFVRVLTCMSARATWVARQSAADIVFISGDGGVLRSARCFTAMVRLFVVAPTQRQSSSSARLVAGCLAHWWFHQIVNGWRRGRLLRLEWRVRCPARALQDRGHSRHGALVLLASAVVG